MKSNTFWAAVSKMLAVVTVMLIVILVLAPGVQAASKYKILHKFTGGSDGDLPNNTLVLDAAGNLYGTTVYGGVSAQGNVFELTRNSDGSWTLGVLYSFTGGSDGSQPLSELIFDAADSLYGTTRYGGDYGYGTVFELTPNSDGSWTESVLHSFTGSDGSTPYEAPTFDGAGNLYGKTWAGGTQNLGVVYELTPNSDGSWTESVLHSFTAGKDGAYPDRGPVIFDASGNLYGVTGGGGTGTCSGAWGTGCGVIFELTPQSGGGWTETVLHQFKGGKDGAVPQGLIFDRAGTTLYGVTAMGGGGPCRYTIKGCGTVFKLTSNSRGGWTERVLHRFQSSPDGANPWASPIFDTAGNLYGTTLTGGKGGCGEWMNRDCGTVFKVSPNSHGGWTERALHRFDHTAANHPFAGVILDSQGNIYGDGEGSRGAVFEIMK
jgi:uncharacterized repeat protein (TIGR03803 family)